MRTSAADLPTLESSGLTGPGDALRTGWESRQREALLGWMAYVTVAVVWGSTYLGIAVALRSFSPAGLVHVRFGIAAVLCLLLGRLRKEPLPKAAEVPAVLLAGALMLGVCNGLVSWAELHVSSGLAAIMCALVPVILGILTVRSEPLGVRGWLGAALGLLGVVILSAPQGGPVTHLGGVLAVLGSTVVWSWGTLFLRKNVRSGGVLTSSGIQMVVASALGGTVAAFDGRLLVAPLTTPVVLAVLYLAVVGSCLAYTAFSYLTNVWPAAKAGTYAYLNPLVAVVLGAVLLGEPFDLRMATGMLVILLGVALVQLRRLDPAGRLPAATSPTQGPRRVA